MHPLGVQTRYNHWQNSDRFSAALRLQNGTCAKRYALKQMPFRQHAFVQDADNFNNIVSG